MQLPADKLGHYFYGQVMTLLMLLFVRPILILLVVFLVSLYKEWWDHKNNGHVEVMDIVATLFGSAVIIGVSMI